MHLGSILCFGNCTDRACAFARAAIDAGLSIDLELGIALRDRFYRASACAGAAADAFRTDYSCHCVYLLVKTTWQMP